MTSLRIRLFATLAAIELIILGSLFALSLSAGEHGGNLLLAVPRGEGSGGLNPERVEELWDGEFLLTYEARQTKPVHALNSRHSVTLVGTNESYPAVMGYRMLSGGFFTEAAREGKRRQTVLNAEAAFALFGSNNVNGSKLKIDDETWTVVGVVDDGIDEARLYAPAAILELDTLSFMVLMDGQRATREYASNALKNVGIYEDQYEMIDLAAETAGYWERFSIATMGALCAALALLLRALSRKAAAEYRAVRDSLSRMYFRELIFSEFPRLVKVLLVAAAILACTAAIIFILTRMLESTLSILDLTLGARRLAVNDFAEKIEWLQGHLIIGNALLAAALPVSVAAALAGFAREKNKAASETRSRQSIDKPSVGN